MTGFHGGMFTGRTFPIIFITHYNRWDAILFIIPLDFWHGTIFPRELIFDSIALTIEKIHCPGKHIIGNIIQMATEPQPWSCHGNMICSAFTLRFYEQLQAC